MARLALLPVVAIAALLLSSPASALAQYTRDDAYSRDAERFDNLRAAGKFKEAEAYLLELIQKYRRSEEPRYEFRLTAILADLYLQQDRFPEALPIAERALAGCTRHFGANDATVGTAMRILARAYSKVTRLEEAIALNRKARPIMVANFGAQHKQVLGIDEAIAGNLEKLGRYNEAEPIMLSVLAARRRNAAGRPEEGIAIALNNLADQYFHQARHKEAERLLLESSEIYVQLGLGEGVERAKTLRLLAEVYQAQSKYEEAVTTYKFTHKVFVRVLGPDHPMSVMQDQLADVYASMHRYEEAEALFNESLAFATKYYGADSPHVFDAQSNLAILYLRQQRFADAEKLAIRQQAHADQPHIPRSVLGKLLARRALIAQFLEKPEEARKFIIRAVELELEQRAGESGGEEQRTQSLSATHYLYDLAAEYHFKADLLSEGFNYCERGRARTLMDQMALGQVDLYAGLSPERANQLRAAYEQAQQQTAELERAIDVLDNRSDLTPERKAQIIARFGEELNKSRERQTQVYASIRNESPVVRRVIGQNVVGASLADVQSYLKKQRALMLYYMVAAGESWLLVIDGEQPVESFQLNLDEASAKTLDAEAGAFNTATIQEVLLNNAKTGVLQLLSNPKSGTTCGPKLHALGQQLLPEKTLTTLRAGTYQRLIVVPDGPLAMLPFEALVVEEGPQPKYLLDVAPAISYAPSATVLMNLAERLDVAVPPDRDPVLALGDPAYSAPAAGDPNEVANLDKEFRSRGGTLSRLPYSGLEAAWVAEVFSKHGQKASVLRERAATEAAVRANAPNRRILHLACHGLMDDTAESFYAALALAPGGGSRVNPKDDGFLTMNEIYTLDLRACELAILSACQTNYGPQRKGEGVWALSRAFLVGGARRVVASNWLVDDKAGASLISYSCGALVKQPKDETDYAEALMEAKRWTRAQSQWQHPYYWATFVMIGPP